VADNRMWLVHRPTGKAIMLAKMLASPWYKIAEAEEIEEFLDHIYTTEIGTHSDFVLALEDASNAPGAYEILHYDEIVDGYRTVILEKDKAVVK